VQFFKTCPPCLAGRISLNSAEIRILEIEISAAGSFCFVSRDQASSCPEV
jgi:hypothetical protein